MGKKDRRRGDAAPTTGATAAAAPAAHGGLSRRLVWIGLALALTLIAAIGLVDGAARLEARAGA